MTKKYTPSYTFNRIFENRKKLFLEVLPVIPVAKKLLMVSVPFSETGTPKFSTIRDSEIRLDAWYWWFNHGRRPRIETESAVSFSVDNSGRSEHNSGSSKTTVSSVVRRWAIKSEICKFLIEIGFIPIRQDSRDYKKWGTKPTKVVYTVFSVPGSPKILAEPEMQECRSLLFDSREEYEKSVLDDKLVTLEFARKLNHKKIKGTNTYSLSDVIWGLIYDAKRKGLLRRK